eukprot:scaffold4251_cov430-Prasinococcus_capsulatus_cf.AAC.9
MGRRSARLRRTRSERGALNYRERSRGRRVWKAGAQTRTTPSADHGLLLQLLLPKLLPMEVWDKQARADRGKLPITGQRAVEPPLEGKPVGGR